jgi:hypothetical protein
MTTEKPFLVFAGNTYYPSGGWSDLRDSFETLDDAKDFLIKTHFDWSHIIDIRTQKLVYYH